MNREPQEIEVEVVETIDSVPRRDRPPPADGPAGPQPWQAWRGRIRTLDRRWWPVWVVLGIVLLVLALTVGLVAAAAWLIVSAVLRAIRALFK